SPQFTVEPTNSTVVEGDTVRLIAQRWISCTQHSVEETDLLG
ncbi:hypothetical protein CEXT_639551, partial [Caerostris extrusa]